MSKTNSSFKSANFDSKNLEPDVKLYIRNLEKENLKLQSVIAKLKVSNLSYSNEKIAMEKEIKNLSSQKCKTIIYLPEKDPVPTPPI